MVDRVYDTDVLVIGSGMAGMYAALEASTQGVNVLLITKGFLGRSSGTVRAGYYMVPGKYTPPDSEEDHFRDLYKSFTYFLGDQELIRTIVKIGNEMVRELEEMGIYWRRYPDGSLKIGAGAWITEKETERKVAKKRNIYGPITGGTGKSIMDVLRGELMRREIPVLEETTATSLLTNAGTVVGATALNYANGEFLVIRAKSVILATGQGGGYFWSYATSTRHLTGDGLAMAYRVGAEAMGMEFQFWHESELTWPEAWRGKSYMWTLSVPPLEPMEDLSPTIDWRGHYVDSKGRRFMEYYELAPVGERCMAVWREIIAKGLGTPEGGWYADWRHLDPKLLDEYTDHHRVLKKLGFPLKDKLIPVQLGVHTSFGGIRINTKTETNIAGLYAVGGAAACFMPTMHTALATAKLAAKHASERASMTERPELDWEQIKREEERIFSYLKTEPREGLLPAQIKKRIREIMWQKMNFVKNEGSMREALDELRKIREDMLPKMRLDSDTRRFNYDWVDAFEVVNMLDVCEIIINASLLRKESRGVFRREEYPETDNENWLRNIVVKLENGKMKMYTVPVSHPYFKPGD